MKVLILLACIAVASAGFVNLKSATKPLVNIAVKDFTRGMQTAKPLHSVLKTKRSLELVKLERQIQTDLGQLLQEQLNNVMAQIQDAIDHGQLVAQSLIDKAKELLQQLAESGANIFMIAQQFIGMLLESGQNLISQILGGLGIGKRDISLSGIFEMLNELANSINLENLIQTIMDKFLNGLGQSRDIITDLLLSLLGSVLDSIDLSSIPIIGDLLGLLGKRGAMSAGIWDNIVDTLGSIWNGISDSFSDFKDWVQQLVQSGLDVAQGHILNIQQLAAQFVQDASHLTVQTIAEAIEFFRPYHEDLGAMWQQILDIQSSLIG